MGKKYFTLTGTSYRYGNDFLTKNAELELVKEPDNKYDKEAIRVEVKGMGLIGYVANSAHTVKGDSLSAGRLYDHIGNKARAKVVAVIPEGAICRVKKKSLIKKNRLI